MARWTERVLCRGCLFRRDCPVYEGLKKPIVQCAWFEPDPAVSDEIVEDTLREGLCATCALRRDCAERGEDGGVWHCEKYRGASGIWPPRRSVAQLFKDLVEALH